MCEIMDEIVRGERIESAIEATIETYKDMDTPKSTIIEKLMTKYGLTKDEATKKVEEY